MVAAILAYHRIADEVFDPLQMSVAPRHLTEHVLVLKELAEIVPLTDVLIPAKHPRVAITFDDGYRDSLTRAAPILAAADAPGTFFIVSSAINRTVPFWWDLLTFAFQQDARQTRRVLRNAGFRLPPGRTFAFRTAFRRLRRLSLERRDEILRGLSINHEDQPLLLSTKDLRELADTTDMAIGAHSRSHRELTSLSPDEQREEIGGSSREIASVIGYRPRSFAYPFGSKRSFDVATQGVVRDEGFELACANFPGRIEGNRQRFQLPRITIHDWSRERFKHIIESVLAG